MSNDWPIEIDFNDSYRNMQKRMHRQERRPSGFTSASQMLGPGAGPFAVLINDWNDEAATFTGVFYSTPGAMNAPDADGDPPGTPSTVYWLAETYGVDVGGEEGDVEKGRWGFQRLTRYRHPSDVADAPPAGHNVRFRRFFPDPENLEVSAYTSWLIV